MMNRRILLHFFTGIVLLLAFSVTLNSCKDSGGITNTNDSDDSTSSITKITGSFETENTSFLPGEIQLIDVEGMTLQEDEYDAELANGTAVTLYRNTEDTESKTLIFVVPEEASGDHKLIFGLEEQELSLEFEIGEYEVIEDPELYTNNFMEGITEELQLLIDETEEGAFKDRLVATKDTLEQKKVEISTLTEQEIKLLARIISSHFKTNSFANNITSVFGSVQTAQFTCPENLAEKVLSSAAGAGVSLYAFSLSGTIATTGWGALVGGITATISGTTLYVSLKSLKSNLITLWDCNTEYFDRALSALAELNPLKQKSGAFAFEHGKEKSFNVISEFKMPEEIQAALNEVKSYMDNIIALIPEEWIEVINREYVTTEEDNPIGVLVQNLSDDRIQSTISTKDDQLIINFTYDKDRILDGENTSFTFELTKEGYNKSITIEATLKPLLPIAYNGQVAIPENTSNVSDTLQADYAADFIIENTPVHGTVTLDNVFTGEFTYQADEGYTGEDSFTFSASNSSGNSDTKVVSIVIADDDPSKIPTAIQGNWEMKEEYGDGYAITILVINSEEILTIIYESYKKCWEGPYNEMDPNDPGERDGDTYTYYSQDTLENLTLSNEDGMLRMEAANDPSIFILIPESDKDIDSLSPQCEGG